MIQYLLLSLKFRQQVYETIGGLFKEVKQNFIELKLNDRIMLAIVELVAVLEFLIDDFGIELTTRKLMCYSGKFTFLKMTQEKENLFKVAA